MATAAKKRLAFSIDDTQTVEDNVLWFSLELKKLDAELATILGASLIEYSNEVSVDEDVLLDALYAATAPKADTDKDPKSESACQ